MRRTRVRRMAPTSTNTKAAPARSLNDHTGALIH